MAGSAGVLVSVITPTYNAAAFVAETIRSVQAQTKTDWEMVIVDDVSTDQTMDIVVDLAAGDPRIRVHRLAENGGAAVSRNTAIERARGRYIAFLDSDDLWLPHKLARQIDFMRETGTPFTYSGYRTVDEEGRAVGAVGVPESVDYHTLLKCNVIGCLTAVYDTAHFGKVYMPSIRKRQDFGLWLRLLRQIDAARGLRQALAVYRLRTRSVSSNKLASAEYNWKLYREIEKLPRHKAAYYFGCYAMSGVLRSKAPGLARRLGYLHPPEIDAPS